MKILEFLQDYCEQRQFRLTVQDNKLHLVWFTDQVRMATFDDVSEMLDFVENRNV